MNEDLRDVVGVGNFVEYTMVTDTQVFEIVGITPSGLRIRGTVTGELKHSENRDGNPYPVVWRECLPCPEAVTQLVRRRKDGTYRIASWAGRLRPAQMIDGVPVKFTDYRF